jgi:hypothetical protein
MVRRPIASKIFCQPDDKKGYDAVRLLMEKKVSGAGERFNEILLKVPFGNSNISAGTGVGNLIKAEEAVLSRLQEDVLGKILDAGHFIPVNSAMLKSEGIRALLARILSSCCLLETDGPYTMTGTQKSRPAHVHHVVSELSGLWRMSVDEVQDRIQSNFKGMLRILDEARTPPIRA